MSLPGYDSWKTTPDSIQCEFCGKWDCEECLEKFEEIRGKVQDPGDFLQGVYWDYNDDREKELEPLGIGYLQNTFSETFPEYRTCDFDYYCGLIGIEDGIISKE